MLNSVNSLRSVTDLITFVIVNLKRAFVIILVIVGSMFGMHVSADHPSAFMEPITQWTDQYAPPVSHFIRSFDGLLSSKAQDIRGYFGMSHGNGLLDNMKQAGSNAAHQAINQVESSAYQKADELKSQLP